MKILWIDCETTGLDPSRNDIITLSLIAEIDKEVKETLTLKIQPMDWNNIEEEAIKTHGITKEQMRTFDPPKKAHNKLIAFLTKYVDRYNKKDKFQPAGYNVTFDMLFLGEFFKKVEDKYFGAWIDYHKFDVATLVQFFHLKGILNFENYKLATVASQLGVDLQAHDSEEDIVATRKVCYKLLDMLEDRI